MAGGTVNPNGAETTVYVQFGLTTSYGFKTVEHKAGSWEAKVGASWNLGGLKPKTTYHFRFVATNSYGTSYGADLQFFTSASEPPPGLPEFAVKTGGLTEVEWRDLRLGATWELPNRDTWRCYGGSMKGEMTGRKTVKGKIAFTSCQIEGGNCETKGAGKEEIQTVELEGKLVYLSKTAKTIGINFRPISGELVIPEFKCRGIRGEVRGSIIFPILTPLNTPGKSLTWGKMEEIEGVQKINEYEKEPGVKVHSALETNWPAGWTSLGWRIDERFTETNKEFEIKG